MGAASRPGDPENNSRHWCPPHHEPGHPQSSSVRFSGAENTPGEIKGHVLFSWGLC